MPGRIPRVSTAAEFVCNPCQLGECARCNDRACTCCYGGDGD